MSGENRKKYYRSLNEFFDFLFPQVCVFCGNYVEDFSHFGSICEKCRKKVTDEFFGGFMENVNGIERVWYVGIYRSLLKECINKFKFFGELTLGNFLAIYLNLLPIFKRKLYTLLPYAFLNPVYWILHSIAAYKALWQLFTKPYYWEKTQHGLSNTNSLETKQNAV